MDMTGQMAIPLMVITIPLTLAFLTCADRDCDFHLAGNPVNCKKKSRLRVRQYE